MVSSVASILLSTVQEHMSKIWLELALASIAAMYYLFLSTSASAKKPNTTLNRGQQGASPFTVKESYVAPIQYQADKELTASQLILQAMAQGRFEEGITMMQRSPMAIRRVPTDLACNLLLAATQFPRAGMADQLKVLTGKISSPALDLAIGETMKTQDFEKCRRLHMISGLHCHWPGRAGQAVACSTFTKGLDCYPNIIPWTLEC